MGQTAATQVDCRPAACCCCCPIRGPHAAGGEAHLRASGRTVAGADEALHCERCGAVCRAIEQGGSWDQPEQPELGGAGDEQLPRSTAAAFAAADAAFAKVAASTAKSRLDLGELGQDELRARLEKAGLGVSADELQRRLEKAGLRVGVREVTRPADLGSTADSAASTATAVISEEPHQQTPLESAEDGVSATAASAVDSLVSSEGRAKEGELEQQRRQQLPQEQEQEQDSDAEASDLEDGEEEGEPLPGVREVPPGPLPSVGSAGHATGTCKRCCFHPTGRCTNGADCNFCHYEHERRRRGKRRSKAGLEAREALAAAAAGEPSLAVRSDRTVSFLEDCSAGAFMWDEDCSAGAFMWDEATLQDHAASVGSIPGTGIPTPEYPMDQHAQHYMQFVPDGSWGGGQAVQMPDGSWRVADPSYAGAGQVGWMDACAHGGAVMMQQGGMPQVPPNVVLGSSPLDVPMAQGQPVCAYMHGAAPAQVVTCASGMNAGAEMQQMDAGAMHGHVFRRPSAR